MVPPFVMASATWPSCDPAPEICFDGADNDCDGLVDCNDIVDCGDDPDCCTITEEIEVSCNDGLDNDCDALIDAADPDCAMACADYRDKGSCNNDPNCEWIGSPKNGTCQDAVPCVPSESPEVTCDDGIDNDCDGLTDCADILDCGNEPVCQIDCSVYTTRNLCRSQTGCRWDNKNSVCVSQ